jgi:membrane protein DedA with SNARE-associated domain
MTNEPPVWGSHKWSLVPGQSIILPYEARLNSNKPKTWLPFALLAAALVVWAGLFALGAFLEWGADQPRHDLRKPLIILGTMAAFLAFWGLALWLRAGRTRKKP